MAGDLLDFTRAALDLMLIMYGFPTLRVNLEIVVAISILLRSVIAFILTGLKRKIVPLWKRHLLPSTNGVEGENRPLPGASLST